MVELLEAAGRRAVLQTKNAEWSLCWITGQIGPSLVVEWIKHEWRYDAHAPIGSHLIKTSRMRELVDTKTVRSIQYLN